MHRMIHVCVSVRGMLRKSNAELRRMASSITVDGKRLKTADEVREALYDELSKGREVLPVTGCDNFDFKKGCLGHDVPDENDKQNVKEA